MPNGPVTNWDYFLFSDYVFRWQLHLFHWCCNELFNESISFMIYNNCQKYFSIELALIAIVQHAIVTVYLIHMLYNIMPLLCQIIKENTG